MAPALDCALEALPHEIKLVIVAHLAPSSPFAAFRTHAYLSGLCRASPSLYIDLEAVFNSGINITDRVQFARLVELAPNRIRNQVRTARLCRVTPAWHIAELDLLAQSLPRLTELRIEGGVDGNKRELLKSLRGLPLERLEVDFGPSHPSPRRTRFVRKKQATLPWNARLRTLCFEDCSFTPDDFVRILARPLERLELLHCTDIDARALADAICVAGIELRYLAIDTTPSAANRSPLTSPHSSPTLSSRSTTSLPTALRVGVLLPHLASLTNLHVLGDALDKADLANLARHAPALRSLRLESNPHLSLFDLTPLLSPTSSSYLARLSYLRFEPAIPASLADLCLEPTAEEQQRTAAAVEELWRAALAANVELAGAPFRELQDWFDWAAREVAKLRSGEDGSDSSDVLAGSPARQRRKRPSLAPA